MSNRCSMATAAFIAADPDNYLAPGRHYVCASVIHMLATHGFRALLVPDGQKLVAAWLLIKHGMEVRP